MGSVGKRIALLEKRYQDQLDAKGEEAKDALRQVVLTRLSDQELESYEQALERLLDTDKPDEKDQWIFARVEELYEEVARAEH